MHFLQSVQLHCVNIILIDGLTSQLHSAIEHHEFGQTSLQDYNCFVLKQSQICHLIHNNISHNEEDFLYSCVMHPRFKPNEMIVESRILENWKFCLSKRFPHWD